MTHEERLRAVHAAQLLQDELLGEVFQALDARYVGAWRASRSVEEREQAFYRQRACAEVRAELFKMIQYAAVNEHGSDEVLNAALTAAERSYDQ